MTGCCSHTRAAGKLFSFFAPRYRRRFEKKGPEPSQKHLLTGLEQAGFANASLLEIGCGVGYLHQTLLGRGASSAVGIDLAPRMLAEARQWARDRQLQGRTHYIEGDFTECADDIGVADITLLDKVVCCYPDADSLIHKALDKTRKVIALTYPRDRMLTRTGEMIMLGITKIFRFDFRGYVHNPAQIEQWIREEGYRKSFQDQTMLWLTQVYVRQ